jgi:hypothetical protein
MLEDVIFLWLVMMVVAWGFCFCLFGGGRDG